MLTVVRSLAENYGRGFNARLWGMEGEGYGADVVEIWDGGVLADGGVEIAVGLRTQLEGVGWPHRRGGENMGNEFGGDGHGRIVLFVFVDGGVGFLVMNE